MCRCHIWIIITYFMIFMTHFYVGCVCVCYMSAGADRGQKKVADPLELALNAFVNCWIWVIVVKLRS